MDFSYLSLQPIMMRGKQIIIFIFQQSEIGLWVTGLYLVLVQPVLLLYKSLETRPQQQLYSAGRQEEEEEEEVKERSNV